MPRAEDVPRLPELAAQPPAGRLERRYPDQDADEEEGLVLQRVHQRMVERRLEHGREVPGVQDDRVRRDGAERRGELPHHPAERLPASQRHHRRAREVEEDHGRADAGEDQRRAELGEQEVLRHVEREEVLGERVHGRHERDDPERRARVEGDLLEAGHLEIAAPADAHGAHVEADADRDEGRARPGRARRTHRDCGGPRCFRHMKVADPERRLGRGRERDRPHQRRGVRARVRDGALVRRGYGGAARGAAALRLARATARAAGSRSWTGAPSARSRCGTSGTASRASATWHCAPRRAAPARDAGCSTRWSTPREPPATSGSS